MFISKPRWMALAIVLTAVPAWASVDVEIIKKGAKLTHPSSVTVSPTGRLFVTETSKGRILELHPVTGEILSQITSDQGAFEPTDLAFDASGRTIFWNNFLTGTIFKRDLATGVSTRLADFDGVLISLAVNHQRRVFAAQSAPTPALWEVDPNGIKKPVLIAIVPGMNGIDAGPDGHVSAPDFFTGTGTIRKIDVDTGVVTVVAFHTDFATPVNAIRFQGELVVAELGTGRVVRGSDRAPFISNLVFPAGLAATDDDLFVADRATGTIYQAVKDGVIQSAPLIVKTGLAEPEGMAIDRHGDLLIAETGTHPLFVSILRRGRWT